MDTGLNIERTFNVDLIRAVVTEPRMWETVAEDNQEPTNYVPEVESECWLHVKDNMETIGLFQFKALNAITLEVHPYILPEYRGKIANEAGRMHLQWFADNATRYKKLVGSIPTIYKNVKLYTLMLGYREEGINKSSYLKNGEVHDQWYLGITRDEIERRLKWAA